MDSTAVATTMQPGDTARGTSPDGVYQWLHAKPLYAAIGSNATIKAEEHS